MPDGDLTELAKLKAAHAEAEKAADRAAGAKQTVLDRLRKEFGCENLKAAQKKLLQLNGDADQAEKDFQAALAKYKQDYAVGE